VNTNKFLYTWSIVTKEISEPHVKRTRMRSEDRRALILEQAKKVFAQHSYAEASTSLLAQESGITEPMLYKHFGSKKGLFLAVLHEYSQRFFQLWLERLKQRESQDLLQALTYVILDYGEIMASDPDIHRVLHQAVAETSDPDFAVRVARHNQKVADSISGLLVHAQQAGLLTEDVDLKAATWGYLSMVYTMQYSYKLNMHHELSREVLSQMSRIWLRGLLKGEAPSS
jgi:AcrR family transcriptional regulator